MSFGLPSREYFLKDGSLKEREAYLRLMVDITALLGANKTYAIEEMSKVLLFETQLANVRTLHFLENLKILTFND
jgi:membrane metallo-endopeptidase-like protein 1